MSHYNTNTNKSCLSPSFLPPSLSMFRQVVFESFWHHGRPPSTSFCLLCFLQLSGLFNPVLPLMSSKRFSSWFSSSYLSACSSKIYYFLSRNLYGHVSLICPKYFSLIIRFIAFKDSRDLILSMTSLFLMLSDQEILRTLLRIHTLKASVFLKLMSMISRGFSFHCPLILMVFSFAVILYYWKYHSLLYIYFRFAREFTSTFLCCMNWFSLTRHDRRIHLIIYFLYSF